MTETAITKTGPATIAPAHAAAVRDYVENCLAGNTRRAYRSAWNAFQEWCEAQGHATLPADPAAVAAYLADRASQGAALNTVRVQGAAIAKAHEVAGLPSPVNTAGVRQVLRGTSRQAARPPRSRASGGNRRTLWRPFVQTVGGRFRACGMPLSWGL